MIDTHCFYPLIDVSKIAKDDSLEYLVREHGMNESWAIFIDVEGFGVGWSDTIDAFKGLNAMMEAIYRIGQRAFPNEGERLFCYQFGDGFLISSDFHERDLARATLIGISILRHVLAAGRVARAALVEGGIADVLGCYPAEIRQAQDRSRIELGAGLLITTPVLGEGLIRSVSLGKHHRRGPLFLADSTLSGRLARDVDITAIENDALSLNWVRGEPDGLLDIQQKAELAREDEVARVSNLNRYIYSSDMLKEDWKSNAIELLIERPS